MLSVIASTWFRGRELSLAPVHGKDHARVNWLLRLSWLTPWQLLPVHCSYGGCHKSPRLVGLTNTNAFFPLWSCRSGFHMGPTGWNGAGGCCGGRAAILSGSSWARSFPHLPASRGTPILWRRPPSSTFKASEGRSFSCRICPTLFHPRIPLSQPEMFSLKDPCGETGPTGEGRLLSLSHGPCPDHTCHGGQKAPVLGIRGWTSLRRWEAHGLAWDVLDSGTALA